MIIIVNINNREGISVQITKGTIFSKKVSTVKTLRSLSTHWSSFPFSDQLFFQSLFPLSFFSFIVMIISSELSQATSDGQVAGQRGQGEVRSDNGTFALLVRISKSGL